MTINDSLMILATRFDDTGDWTVEQQFVLQMGSSYLLAHGIGEPLKKDAHTSFEVPDDGDYTLWVRTKNWTAFWSEGLTPGRFQVILDGSPDPAEFGIGKDGDKSDTSREARATRAAWYWQKGGTYALSKGRDAASSHRATGTCLQPTGQRAGRNSSTSSSQKQMTSTGLFRWAMQPSLSITRISRRRYISSTGTYTSIR